MPQLRDSLASLISSSVSFGLQYDPEISKIVIFLDFYSTRQGQPLVDSWSRSLD